MPTAKRDFNSDSNLIQAFLKDRSEPNFIPLYQRFALDLFRMAMHLTKYSRQSAEDIVQETWIVAIQKMDGFNHQSSLKTWLIGILINKWREKNRIEIRNENNTTLEVNTSEQQLQYTMDSQIQILDLKASINQLPEGYRQILILHDVEGYKHHEIAQTLGISEGTSKSQLFQARKAMRKRLMKIP
jgi:RNA polymerase sigma-70 factor, ECF subfamily